MAYQNQPAKAPEDLTPAKALQCLKDGNQRFVNAVMQTRDHMAQVNLTKDFQRPFAAIVSCMDSRNPAELIFDQGLGDIFSIRNAGNVVNNSVLGSLEFATAVVGSKLILVVGHTGCGAIKGACDDVELGHLTALLKKIAPAKEAAKDVPGEHNSSNPEYLKMVTYEHPVKGMKYILENSPIIRELVEKGTVGICPAVYNISSGKVEFFDEKATFSEADMVKAEN